MKRYVVGFAFGPDRERVILIRRSKSDRHQGLYNGPGGHVEARERPEDAVVREFKEEAGILIKRDLWRELAVLNVCNDHEITFFAADIPAELFQAARTASDEGEIFSVNVDSIPQGKMVPPLYWLIPLALDLDVVLPLHVKSR